MGEVIYLRKISLFEVLRNVLHTILCVSRKNGEEISGTSESQLMDNKKMKSTYPSFSLSNNTAGNAVGLDSTSICHTLY